MWVILGVMDLMDYVHEDWYKDRLEEAFADEEAFFGY